MILGRQFPSAAVAAGGKELGETQGQTDLWKANSPLSVILTTTAHLMGSPSSVKVILPVIPSNSLILAMASRTALRSCLDLAGEVAGVLDGRLDDAQRVPGQGGHVVGHVAVFRLVAVDELLGGPGGAGGGVMGGEKEAGSRPGRRA